MPRVPGGDITPEQLILIGEIARDFDLYTKITGGQRIDMFGARVDQLPEIWRRLVEGGMESGHAYGKALRTVKSCVGSDWCRYGQQDSVQMAIDLELRYRGLRAPHKIKMGVSGCARECAEARSKDVGVIATENGWNLYVGGNGGMTPKHAQLLAGDLDDETLVRYVDRFLMFYIRTADRLQRTASWVESLDGGLDHLREVVCNDSLGLGRRIRGRRSPATSTATPASGRACSRIRTSCRASCRSSTRPMFPTRQSNSPRRSGRKVPTSECRRCRKDDSAQRDSGVDHGVSL